jgi:hypothetical protein
MKGVEKLRNEIIEAPLVVEEVELALDGIECGYRIVSLTNGWHAFVWGNICTHVGDRIPRELAENPTAEKGIELHTTFGDCVDEWRAAGEALGDSEWSHTAREVLAAIEHLS